jgi:hypothetical protein
VFERIINFFPGGMREHPSPRYRGARVSQTPDQR